MEQRSLISSCMEDTANKKPSKECKAPPMVARLLTGLFFLLWGNQEEERKSVHFCSINAKGMLIFIVADIWNCYNMDMKKATNLKVLIIFKQPHCMEIRNRLSLK